MASSGNDKRDKRRTDRTGNGRTKVNVAVKITKGHKSDFRLRIDGNEVKVPVPSELMVEFRALFVRPDPSAAQRNRHRVLMQLAEAAYKAGQRSAS